MHPFHNAPQYHSKVTVNPLQKRKTGGRLLRKEKIISPFTPSQQHQEFVFITDAGMHIVSHTALNSTFTKPLPDSQRRIC